MTTRRYNTREFSYTRPIMFQGEYYPSADSVISDEYGNKTEGRIFADANGQYYTKDKDNNVFPVMPVESLDDVVITAQDKREPLLFNRYLTRNDKTQVNNLPHREYNTSLKASAERGAREHTLWDKEHPNLASWRDAATAVPFGIASIPLVAGGGQTLLGTAAGQAIKDGVSRVLGNPIIEAANNAVGLGFAGMGAYNVSQGEFTPETAIDLAGGIGLMAKGTNIFDRMLTARKPLNRIPNSAIEMSNVGDVNLGNLSTYNSKDDYPLLGETRIPMSIRADAAKKYTDFINSEEYLSRLQNAGLENHWKYMKDLTKERVNDTYYFPGKVKPIIDSNPRIDGQSNVDPESLNYGITLRENLPSEKITPTLMHELAHWATGNAGDNVLSNFLFNPVFQFKKEAKKIRNIMKYNEDITLNIPWKEIKAKLPKNMSKDKIAQKKKYYKYLIDPQEKRARAMTIYQQAKDSNMTTDEFIDMWTANGKIVKYAPEWLRNMGEILTPNNLKKYVKSFLSVSAPVGISSSIILNNNQNEYR